MRKFFIVIGALVMLSACPLRAEGVHAITFRIQAPGAQSVEVIGDFNSWTPGSNFLHGPDGNGVWQALIPIALGMRRIEYVYLLDGQMRLTDTMRPVVGDDFGGANNFWLEP